MTDEPVIRGCYSDFESFYRLNYGPTVRLAHLLCGSRPIGEELAQEAFVALYRSWVAVDEPTAYLRRTLSNQARGHLRRRYIAGRSTVSGGGSAQTVLPPELDEAWDTIKRLSVNQRTVIVLRFYEDLTVPEIAAILDLPEGTVKARLHRSLKRLGGLLA